MKKIKDYPNYSCDEHGNVYSTRKKLKKSSRNGYHCVTISNENGSKTKNVHRIVAEAFILNTDNKKYVNHKNGNKTDNRVENLEWVTAKENHLHAIENGFTVTPKNNRPKLSKPVIQFDLDGNEIAVFPSVNEAQRQTGVSTKWISACANGGSYRMSGGVKKWVNCNSANGYKWNWQQVRKAITLK